MRVKLTVNRSWRPDQFIQWRTRMELDQFQAAKLLGVSPRSITYYETGGRGIKLTVTLACIALENWPWLRAKIPELLAEKRGERVGRNI